MLRDIPIAEIGHAAGAVHQLDGQVVGRVRQGAGDVAFHVLVQSRTTRSQADPAGAQRNRQMNDGDDTLRETPEDTSCRCCV